jgi:uncharacterized protein (DUF2344 family)
MQKRILIFSFLVLIFNKLSYLVLLRYQKIGDVEHVLNQVNMIVSSYGTLKKTSKSVNNYNIFTYFYRNVSRINSKYWWRPITVRDQTCLNIIIRI